MNSDMMIRCAACGYDLAGLPPGAVCPECGTAVAAGPETLRDVLSREDLAQMARWLAAAAGLNVAGAILLLAVYLFMLCVAPAWWLVIPLGAVVLAEAGVVVQITRVLASVRSSGVRPGRVLLCGTLLMILKPAAALAAVMPCVSAALGNSAGGSELQLGTFLGGAIAATGVTYLHALLLRGLVRNVASRSSRRWADGLTDASLLVFFLSTVGCFIALAYGPIVPTLGACINAAIAGIFSRAVRD